MSIFGSIASAIFGHAHAAPAPAAANPIGATIAPTAPAAPISRADLDAKIERIAHTQNEDLDWKRSIVDLMKLLKLDGSLAARKQLAHELGYTGATDGSAEMNVWLHKQVMTKLAETGGTVPDSLKHA